MRSCRSISCRLDCRARIGRIRARNACGAHQGSIPALAPEYCGRAGPDDAHIARSSRFRHEDYRPWAHLHRPCARDGNRTKRLSGRRSDLHRAPNQPSQRNQRVEAETARTGRLADARRHPRRRRAVRSGRDGELAAGRAARDVHACPEPLLRSVPEPIDHGRGCINSPEGPGLGDPRRRGVRSARERIQHRGSARGDVARTHAEARSGPPLCRRPAAERGVRSQRLHSYPRGAAHRLLGDDIPRARRRGTPAAGHGAAPAHP